MARNSREHEQTPVDDDSYDVSDIPPEAPEAKWLATPKATLGKSSKGDPMITVNWKLDECLTPDAPGGEDAIGNRVADYLVKKQKDGSTGFRLTAQRIQAFCNHLGIPTKGSLADLVAAINDAGQQEIWTVHDTNKDTGEVSTKVAYREPRGAGGGAKPEEEEEEEEEKPRARSAKKAAGGRR